MMGGMGGMGVGGDMPLTQEMLNELNKVSEMMTSWILVILPLESWLS